MAMLASGRRAEGLCTLVYEAYAPMALSEMRRLGREAHGRFEIAYIGIVHRTGKLEIGETSVVIAVRGAAPARSFCSLRVGDSRIETHGADLEKRDFRGWRGLGRRRGT